MALRSVSPISIDDIRRDTGASDMSPEEYEQYKRDQGFGKPLAPNDPELAKRRLLNMKDEFGNAPFLAPYGSLAPARPTAPSLGSVANNPFGGPSAQPDAFSQQPTVPSPLPSTPAGRQRPFEAGLQGMPGSQQMASYIHQGTPLNDVLNKLGQQGVTASNPAFQQVYDKSFAAANTPQGLQFRNIGDGNNWFAKQDQQYPTGYFNNESNTVSLAPNGRYPAPLVKRHEVEHAIDRQNDARNNFVNPGDNSTGSRLSEIAPRIGDTIHALQAGNLATGKDLTGHMVKFGENDPGVDAGWMRQQAERFKLPEANIRDLLSSKAGQQWLTQRADAGVNGIPTINNGPLPNQLAVQADAPAHPVMTPEQWNEKYGVQPAATVKAPLARVYGDNVTVPENHPLVQSGKATPIKGGPEDGRYQMPYKEFIASGGDAAGGYSNTDTAAREKLLGIQKPVDPDQDRDNENVPNPEGTEAAHTPTNTTQGASMPNDLLDPELLKRMDIAKQNFSGVPPYSPWYGTGNRLNDPNPPTTLSPDISAMVPNPTSPSPVPQQWPPIVHRFDTNRYGAPTNTNNGVPAVGLSPVDLGFGQPSVMDKVYPQATPVAPRMPTVDGPSMQWNQPSVMDKAYPAASPAKMPDMPSIDLPSNNLGFGQGSVMDKQYPPATNNPAAPSIIRRPPVTQREQFDPTYNVPPVPSLAGIPNDLPGPITDGPRVSPARELRTPGIGSSGPVYSPRYPTGTNPPMMGQETTGRGSLDQQTMSAIGDVGNAIGGAASSVWDFLRNSNVRTPGIGSGTGAYLPPPQNVGGGSGGAGGNNAASRGEFKQYVPVKEMISPVEQPIAPVEKPKSYSVRYGTRSSPPGTAIHTYTDADVAWLNGLPKNAAGQPMVPSSMTDGQTTAYRQWQIANGNKYGYNDQVVESVTPPPPPPPLPQQNAVPGVEESARRALLKEGSSTGGAGGGYPGAGNQPAPNGWDTAPGWLDRAVAKQKGEPAPQPKSTTSNQQVADMIAAATGIRGNTPEEAQAAWDKWNSMTPQERIAASDKNARQALLSQGGGGAGGGNAAAGAPAVAPPQQYSDPRVARAMGAPSKLDEIRAGKNNDKFQWEGGANNPSNVMAALGIPYDPNVFHGQPLPGPSPYDGPNGYTRVKMPQSPGEGAAIGIDPRQFNNMPEGNKWVAARNAEAARTGRPTPGTIDFNGRAPYQIAAGVNAANNAKAAQTLLNAGAPQNPQVLQDMPWLGGLFKPADQPAQASAPAQQGRFSDQQIASAFNAREAKTAADNAAAQKLLQAQATQDQDARRLRLQGVNPRVAALMTQPGGGDNQDILKAWAIGGPEYAKQVQMAQIAKGQLANDTTRANADMLRAQRSTTLTPFEQIQANQARNANIIARADQLMKQGMTEAQARAQAQAENPDLIGGPAGQAPAPGQPNAGQQGVPSPVGVDRLNALQTAASADKDRFGQVFKVLESASDAEMPALIDAIKKKYGTVVSPDEINKAWSEYTPYSASEILKIPFGNRGIFGGAREWSDSDKRKMNILRTLAKSYGMRLKAPVTPGGRFSPGQLAGMYDDEVK